MIVEPSGWMFVSPASEARGSHKNPRFHGVNYRLYMVVHHRRNRTEEEDEEGEEGNDVEAFYFDPNGVKYACLDNPFRANSGIVGECKPCHNSQRLMKVSKTGEATCWRIQENSFDELLTVMACYLPPMASW